MKITKKQFEKIIKEELQNYLKEGQIDENWFNKILGKKSDEEIEDEKKGSMLPFNLIMVKIQKQITKPSLRRIMI